MAVIALLNLDIARWPALCRLETKVGEDITVRDDRDDEQVCVALCPGRETDDPASTGAINPPRTDGERVGRRPSGTRDLLRLEIHAVRREAQIDRERGAETPAQRVVRVAGRAVRAPFDPAAPGRVCVQQ